MRSEISTESGFTVSLREVAADTVRAICGLTVKPEQTGFVAPNAVSIAEAYFEPRAWFRAIYADETPVGFVMLYDDPDRLQYYLWRFMVAGEHQGKGFGRRALELVVQHVGTRPGATELRTSYVPGDGSPGAFYRKLGFVETGEVEDGERVLCLQLVEG